MSNKIIEGDGRRGHGGQTFLMNLIRIVVFVILWNLFLRSDLLQNASVIIKIGLVIAFIVLLEIVVGFIRRAFRER